MVNEYKKIVLLKGLEAIDDYHFLTIKSLLAHDLKLSKKMQDEYNRIQIADLMENKFRSDAGVDKLIELFKDIPERKGLVKTLRTEKLKVARKLKAKEATPRKTRNQEEVGPATPIPTGNALASEGAEETPVAQNQTPQAQRQGATRNYILQKGPLTVLVLKATKPFEYTSPEERGKAMFHATVATKSQFFQVKVFNTNLKEKFTKKKVITITDYLECKGVLEINEASSVSEAGENIEVPLSVVKRANETPKIGHLHKQASGTIVYGLFMLQKKTVNKKNTVYEIQDNTGNMEVVGNGKWHNINCEKGNKLRLFYFQLRTFDKKLKLTCGIHSFIKVIKVKQNKKQPVNANSNPEAEIRNDLQIN
ncbi:Myeloid cell nuclear differentiation antigen [Tupaia chinensis]|uniref:Myeloid cell nuclear differentiation antigen n=1 Tax=Tupaia chinensis TaxID=246437 RepID=L9JBB6_TUPCH|nr:Myeloid cell nuclear differentiation antigen [Tupaia chinensis]